MCGIIGYFGKNPAKKVVFDGLKRLEYRGYDSAGISLIEDGRIKTFKSTGKIINLKKSLKNIKLKGNIGIGHTRWATHGKPSKTNAHPHCDCFNRVCLVHNGIIENYKELKQILIKNNHKFKSETDTEVIAHLIGEFLDKGFDFKEAFVQTLKLLKGAYALVVLSANGKIFFAKDSSPLVLGQSKEGIVLASDSLAILPITKKIIYLDDKEWGFIFKTGSKFSFNVFSLKDNIRINKKTNLIDWDIKKIKKFGFKHYMLKEIFEGPESFKNTILGRIIKNKGKVKLGGLEEIRKKILKLKNIVLVGCGTSYYAALYGKYLIENITGLKTDVYFASEFRYYFPPLKKDSLVVFLSQSGETTDTLFAVKEAKNRGFLTIGLVNVVGSSIAREVEAGIYLRSGPEIAVASTKAFLSQGAALVMLALFLKQKPEKKIISEFLKLPKKMAEVLGNSKEIKQLARKYSKYNNFLFLGRGFNYPLALEGALKLKEISYVHAEGYPAGEMKHGPIAMLDKDFPSFVVALKDKVYEKMLVAVEEIKARKAPVLALATKGDKKVFKIANDVIYLPETMDIFQPFLGVLVFQLFAYYVGVLKGFDVDKPRNLAKSVTVE